MEGYTIKIIIDNKEKKPLEFEHPYITEVCKEHLKTGDYQGEFENGKRSQVIIERKAINDLWQTLSNRKKYDRFRREIERAQQEGIYLNICIEGTYSKIQKGYARSTRPGSAISNQLRTLWIKYGVIHTYCVTREEMANYIIDTFIWCGRKKLWV